MSETTAPTGGSNVLNNKKQQELYVQRCNDVFEKMSKAGYKDLVLNIMEARMKDSFEKETDSADSTGEDTSANNDKKKESSLLIGNLPFKKIPFGPYIDLLRNQSEINFTERSVKGKAKVADKTADKTVEEK